MMALRVVSELLGLAWRHPLVSFGILLLFTPPFFPIIRFFSPLLISTAVFVVAMVSLGPSSSKHGDGGVSESEDNWDFRKSSDGGAREWEEKDIPQEQENGDRPSKKRKSSGRESWVDWVKNVEAIGFAWVDQKLKNESENWPGQKLDDHNVSILQEAFGQENLTRSSQEDAEVPESHAMRGAKERESNPSVAKELPVYDESPRDSSRDRPGVVDSGGLPDSDEMLGEDVGDGAVEEEVAEWGEARTAVNSVAVMHEHSSSVPVIQIPPKPSILGESAVENPSTGADEDLGRPRQRVVGSLSRSSDLDSPATLTSASVKLSGVESLAEAIESQDNYAVQQQNTTSQAAMAAGISPAILKALQPSTSDKVNDIIEKLKVFCEDGLDAPPSAPSKKSSPLFKPLPKEGGNNNSSHGKKPKKKQLLDSSDDDTSSGDEVMSDSDSDSGFQIFPAHPTADMKNRNQH
ncbi:unnamed protein product [Sphagnum balticum]